MARYCKVRHDDVARCEVVVWHLAMLADYRVRLSGVAPCDLFLIIFNETEPMLNLAANLFKAGSSPFEGMFGLS